MSDSFLRVVHDHGASLKRLCRGYEADARLRAELEQEVLLELWRALPSFRGEASERTFVLRVAHNVCRRHVSRQSRQLTTEELDETVGQASLAEAAVDQRRRRQALYAAIRRLAPTDRQLVLLHLEGLSNPEVAEVTGLSATNVSTRLSRARAALQHTMGARNAR